MNTRQVEIFLDLLRFSELSIESLMEQYDVTQRTIRLDIHEINHLIDKRGSIVTSDSIIYLISSEEPELLLSYLLEVQQDSFNFSVEARHQIEIFTILLNPYIKYSEDLAESVGVSTGTVLKDLKTVAEHLNDEGIEFSMKQRKGFSVNADDHVKIRKVFNILRTYSNTNVVAYSLLSNTLNNIIERRTIRSIVRSQENLNELSLTDESFNMLVDYIMVVCAYKIEHSLNDEKKSRSRVYRDVFYDFSERIISEITFVYSIHFCDQDVKELALIIRNSTFLQNPLRSNDFELQMLVSASIYETFAELKMKEYLEYDSYITILQHVTTMVERIDEGIMLENPFLDDIKIIYSDVFKVVKRQFKSLEDTLDLKLNDSEISFIVVHVISIVEKNQIMSSLVFITIVGVPSQSLYLLMKNRIQQLLGVKVTKVLSLHNYEKISNSVKLRDEADILITTESIKNDYLPVIRVSPLVKGDDLAEINRTVMTIRQSRRLSRQEQVIDNIKKYVDRVREILGVRHTQEMTNQLLKENYRVMKCEREEDTGVLLSHVMSEKDVALDVEVKSWRSALEMSGDLLLQQGKITDSYIKSMIKNVEKNGPYIMFTPHVAVAHSSATDGGKDVGCSVIRPIDPIVFGHEKHDPCRLIFCLSVIDTENQLQIFFNLMKILSNPEVVELLLSAKNRIEFLEIIRISEMRIGENV